MNDKKKKDRDNQDKHSEKPTKKHTDEDEDKRRPDPDAPNEESGPPIKEMPESDDQNR